MGDRKSCALHRNSTSFPAELTAKLRRLHDAYVAARARDADGGDGDAAGGDSDRAWARLLKYYQYLVRAVMTDPEYGIGADGNARGLLVYHTMGMGKTRLAAAVAMAAWDTRPVVVMLARGLQANLRATVAAVVGLLHPRAGADELARRRAAADARLTFVSMDAYNTADQLRDAGEPKRRRARRRRGDERPAAAAQAWGAEVVGGLDGKLLIVDEAHNLFRAIINGGEGSNARRVYDMVMAARDLRLLFLTGTPASKDPFELVPCFNMLAGWDLLPPVYETFTKLYVDRDAHAVRNRGHLANRLVGLVSHVTHTRPSEVAGQGAAGQGAARQPGDEGWFPVELATVVERVPMGAEQYRRYLLAREKEEAEGRAPGGAAAPRAAPITSPALSLPGSERMTASTYHVWSRTLGNFAPAGVGAWEAAAVGELPVAAFTAAAGPKLARIARRAAAAPGPVLIYSQFVESGLKPMARYLELAGFAPYFDAAADAGAGGAAAWRPFEPADVNIDTGDAADIDDSIVRNASDSKGAAVGGASPDEVNYYCRPSRLDVARLRVAISSGAGPKSTAGDTPVNALRRALFVNDWTDDAGQPIAASDVALFPTRHAAHEARIAAADPAVPVIVVDDGHGLWVAGGLYQLARATREGRDTVPTVTVALGDLAEFSVDATTGGAALDTTSATQSATLDATPAANLIVNLGCPSLNIDVPLLWRATSHLPVVDVPLDRLAPRLYAGAWSAEDDEFDEQVRKYLPLNNAYSVADAALSPTKFPNHTARIANANLDYPIILVDHDGSQGSQGSVPPVADGHHRLARAARDGHTTVRARFISFDVLRAAALATGANASLDAALDALTANHAALDKQAQGGRQDRIASSLTHSSSGHGQSHALAFEPVVPGAALAAVDEVMNISGNSFPEISAIREAAVAERADVDPWYDPEREPAVRYRGGKSFTVAKWYNLHHGQRKLFVSELQLLTLKLASATEAAVAVYAGAAPGFHIPELRRLFPGVVWHLYDPAPFLYPHGTAEAAGIHDYNEYFTDEVAASWAGRCDFFVCDIRIGTETGGAAWSPEFEAQVARDMAAQDRWTRLARPRLGALLKFRPPYVDAGQECTLDYIRGRVLWQTWPSKSSTEGRLLVDGADATLESPPMRFDVMRYQDACAEHNQIDRAWATYAVPARDAASLAALPGYDRCFDCANEAAAWRAYAALPGAVAARGGLTGHTGVAAYMATLTRVTHQRLDVGVSRAPPYHGRNTHLPAARRNVEVTKAVYARGDDTKRPHDGPKAPTSFRASGDVVVTANRAYDIRRPVGIMEWVDTKVAGADPPLSIDGTSSGDKTSNDRPRYAIISGDVPAAERDAVVKAATDPANMHGGVLKAILVSKTGAEGLDLKWIREVHVVEQFWDRARTDQVVARAARLGSHDGLPREERVVQPYVYLAVANPAVWAARRPDSREAQSIDEVFYERAESRYATNVAVRGVLAEVSLECSLFGYGNCRECMPTGAPLFHADYAADARLPDPCVVSRATDVRARRVEVDGRTFFGAPDPAAPHGWAIYVARPDLGGHAAADPADPALPAVVAALTAK